MSDKVAKPEQKNQEPKVRLIKRFRKSANSALGILCNWLDAVEEESASEGVLRRLSYEMEYAEKYADILSDAQEYCQDNESPSQCLERLREERLEHIKRYR